MENGKTDRSLLSLQSLYVAFTVELVILHFDVS